MLKTLHSGNLLLLSSSRNYKRERKGGRERERERDERDREDEKRGEREFE
jgi:hypothetical protein